MFSRFLNCYGSVYIVVQCFVLISSLNKWHSTVVTSRLYCTWLVSNPAIKDCALCYSNNRFKCEMIVVKRFFLEKISRHQTFIVKSECFTDKPSWVKLLYISWSVIWVISVCSEMVEYNEVELNNWWTLCETWNGH